MSEAVTKRVGIPRTTTPSPPGDHDPGARRPRAVPERPDVYLVRVLVLHVIGTAEVVELVEGNDVTILGHLDRADRLSIHRLGAARAADLHVWVDEEGLFVAAPALVNRAASVRVFGRAARYVGTVVDGGGSDGQGRTMGLSEERLDWLIGRLDGLGVLHVSRAHQKSEG